MATGRLLVAAWSDVCREGRHTGCAGRAIRPGSRELLICPCACHDVGGTAALKAVMSMLGKRGGPKGGRARAASLSPTRRQEIARNAARKRWRKGA